MSRAVTRGEFPLGFGYEIVKKWAMRRTLVLTDEQSRHPFRSTLPAHVRSDEYAAPAECLWRLTQQDVQGFASTYVAVFAAVLVFIA